MLPIDASVEFRVEVHNALGLLSYQWYRVTEDKAMESVGVDSPVHAIDPITEEDVGEYQCEVYDTIRDETAWSPVFTLVLGSGVPAAGLLGLAVGALLTALAGSVLTRRKS